MIRTRRRPGLKPRPTSTAAKLFLHINSGQRPVCRVDAGVHGEWSRRREAAKRLPPLECGCRDPWPCRCHGPTVESDNQIDGWAAAARHLALNGLLPVLPVEAMRALWRRGGDDRALVVSIRIGIGEGP